MVGLGGTKKGGATPSVIGPDEIHDCSCPTVGVAPAQIAWLGDVRVFEAAPLVTLVAQLRLASSHFSCLTLPSKDLSCHNPTAQQREVMLLIAKSSQDPAGSRGSTSFGRLCTTLQYTGKDFLCTSISNTAVTTFWLCGRQPVCECLLKIVVGSSPVSDFLPTRRPQPHILPHHNSYFRFGHC